MRFGVRKTAHVFERVGLAMAGAACGLFVGAYVGSAIPTLTTQGFLLLMMALGAVGFYLGIDTPQMPFDDAHGEIDAAEFLSSAGTLCATLTALGSVAVIVLRLDPHMAWTWLVFAGWIAGVAMQIVAGAKSRMRK
ncbi:putative membrane protein YfcA [Bradyrhizobium sp. USDA 4354]